MSKNKDRLFECDKYYALQETLFNWNGESRETDVYYRIYAKVDIKRHGVKAGDRGGFIGGGKVLSPEGDCWIKDNAMAMRSSRIRENALLSNFTEVYGGTVCGNARLWGFCFIGQGVQVEGDSVFGGINAGVGGWCIISRNIREGAEEILHSIHGRYQGSTWKDATEICGDLRFGESDKSQAEYEKMVGSFK